MRRWITLAVVAWLTLVLAGREHVLQSVGIELACIHPGDSASPHPTTRGGGGHDAHARHGGGIAALSDLPDEDGSGEDGPGDGGSHVDAPDADGGDDCPAGCTECACGAAPCAATTTPFVVATRTWHVGEHRLDPSRAGPSRSTTTLDRPPRRG